MIRILLYHTSHCPNCHAQQKILEQVKKQQPDLDIQSINLEKNHNISISPPIQSVPTMIIGEYRFEGLLSAEEINKWINTETLDRDYIYYLLKSGQLLLAQQWLQTHTYALTQIIDLLGDETIEMTVRIGLDALLENLAETGLLTAITTELGNLLDTAPDSLCIDLLHYLSMIGTDEARNYIETCLTRQHPEVQRIAHELLDELNDEADTSS